MKTLAAVLIFTSCMMLPVLGHAQENKKFSWTAPLGTVSTYFLYVKNGATEVKYTTTSKTVTLSLQAGSYTASVSAVNSAGESPRSTVVTFSVKQAPTSTTPTPTPTPTNTATSTQTGTATATPTSTTTPTTTTTPTPIASATATPNPTITVEPSPTPETPSHGNSRCDINGDGDTDVVVLTKNQKYTVFESGDGVGNGSSYSGKFPTAIAVGCAPLKNESSAKLITVTAKKSKLQWSSVDPKTQVVTPLAVFGKKTATPLMDCSFAQEFTPAVIMQDPKKHTSVLRYVVPSTKKIGSIRLPAESSNHLCAVDEPLLYMLVKNKVVVINIGGKKILSTSSVPKITGTIKLIALPKGASEDATVGIIATSRSNSKLLSYNASTRRWIPLSITNKVSSFSVGTTNSDSKGTRWIALRTNGGILVVNLETLQTQISVSMFPGKRGSLPNILPKMNERR